MAFDYKKEYKEFYLPKNKPELVTVPPMRFAAVRGSGNPNEEGGPYKQAIGLLYGIAFTIKMSKRNNHRIEGYFDYVVPPLEGLWWQEEIQGVDYSRKDDFQWISMIRLPEFVTQDTLNWAKAQAEAKKKTDFSPVEFLTYDEGFCVQCMHIGPYDREPATIAIIDAFTRSLGYLSDMDGTRYHHEIYLSDVRKCKPENLKTVIRHPIKAKI
ncbi:MAG: transcriptional regulator [Clostridiales bacterium]|nr:transcriptional regulator [Clostridiales bacterium]